MPRDWHIAETLAFQTMGAVLVPGLRLCIVYPDFLLRSTLATSPAMTSRRPEGEEGLSVGTGSGFQKLT